VLTSHDFSGFTLSFHIKLDADNTPSYSDCCRLHEDIVIKVIKPAFEKATGQAIRSLATLRASEPQGGYVYNALVNLFVNEIGKILTEYLSPFCSNSSP